jgi:hypothetical protein
VLSEPCSVASGASVGSMMIDSVSVATEIPEERSQYDESFLTDADWFAYLAGALMMQDAASIRLENPCGLRFTTEIDESLWETITEHFTVSDMGTLILPADIAEGAEAFTKEALDALDGTAYLDIKYEEDFDGAAGHSFEGGRYFTASIVQIKEENLARDFVGISYVTLTLADGETVTLYSDAAVANATATAEAALTRTDVEWTDAQTEILEALSGS